MTLSLIIPVYNERAAIGACLANLAALEGEVEVRFADGGSTDGTAEAIAAAGYRVLSCPKGRAAQMNAAAGAAGGEVLWFSHCDSLLPPDGPEQIRRAAAAHFAAHFARAEFGGHPFRGARAEKFELHSDTSFSLLCFRRLSFARTTKATRIARKN